ncbi:MAG: ATP-binding cassette domain-containing protein [Dissulfuribacterales bacterium]
MVPDKGIGFVRGVCGAFLFSGQDVDKAIDVLSGGEKARVSLAKLLVKPGNLMLMDEPTNHLDISSSEALINALSEYNGTLLFVSHNHSFIKSLATKIWDIRKGKIIEYPGNLAEYFHHIALMKNDSAGSSLRDCTNEESGKNKTLDKKEQDRKKDRRQKAERRQLVYNTLKPLLAEVKRLERQIAVLEVRQKNLEKLFGDPDIFSDKNRGVPLLREHKALREKQDKLLLKWEQNQDKLEITRKELGVGLNSYTS